MSLFELGNTIFILFMIMFTLCFVPSFFLRRRELNAFKNVKTEIVHTAYDPSSTYETIVKEIANWRRRSARKRSVNPFKWGRLKFTVHKAIPSKLYRVVDRDVGVVAFELSPLESGGTTVKMTFSEKSQASLNIFKAKLPRITE